MDYSPKLKMAMQEFKALCKKHDIAASIILFAPDRGHYFSEVLCHVEASWSCAHLHRGPEGEGIRIKAKLKDDFNGDKTKQHEQVQTTGNMIEHFIDTNAFMWNNFTNVKKRLEEAWGWESNAESKFTPGGPEKQ